MNIKKKRIENLCTNALERIDAEIMKHKKGAEKASLSIPMLFEIKNEIEQMLKILEPSIFKPSYPRFMLDWPEESNLIDFLSDVAYQYERL